MTFSGNAFRASRDQAVGPLGERVRAALVEALDLLLRQPRRELRRRQPRAVEDLVGVGVADPGEEARIGQRALDRVVLARQRLAKRGAGPRRATSRPPRSNSASASSPRTRWSEARFFVLASVSRSVPSSKSNAASAILSARPRRRAPSSAAVRRPSGGGRGRGRPPARRRSACRSAGARRPVFPSASRRSAARPSAAGTGSRSGSPTSRLPTSTRGSSAVQVRENVRQLRHASSLPPRANSLSFSAAASRGRASRHELDRRYTHWLHTRWPAGTVEKLPEVREDGTTAVPGVRIVGDLTGVPLLKFSSDTGARAVQRHPRGAGFRPAAPPDRPGRPRRRDRRRRRLRRRRGDRGEEGGPLVRGLRGDRGLLDGRELPEGKADLHLSDRHDPGRGPPVPPGGAPQGGAPRGPRGEAQGRGRRGHLRTHRADRAARAEFSSSITETRRP